MVSMNMLVQGNVLLALGAAVLWGGGDFAGGMGVKTAGGGVRAALRVVLLSHAASFMTLVVIARMRGDIFPHGALLAWGVGAGVAGGISLTCFYVAISRGAMGAAAAVSGLLAAAIPAAVAMGQGGSPGVRPVVGFLVAGFAIWMIAAGSEGEGAGSRETMWLAGLAGAGFGIYFVALKMAGAGGVVWPMATARMGSLSICTVLALVFGRGRDKAGLRFGRGAAAWALGTAVMDTSGNMLFLAATRAGRLDIAAVLASLYPASTILLAAAVLRQRPTRRQALGMVAAVVAVVLIAG